MSAENLTRPEADLMALRFLRDSGPHTMGTIDTEEAFAAALVFVGLKAEGLVASAKMAPGHVQWSITPAGLEWAA